MPELPEVETVRAALDGALKNARITDVIIRRKDVRIPFPSDLAKRLTGRNIIAVTRRAKYLLIEVSGGDTVIAHLGMSGHFSVDQCAPQHFAKHDHLVLFLDDGRCVTYNDPRRFGLITLCKTRELIKHPLLASLGPEPLSKDFSARYLKEKLQKRSASIKAAIMDQAVVVGVGNIYASEAFFLAGILPNKAAHTAITKAPELVKAIQKVLRDAIKSGGSSLRDFYYISGETGYFQHHFHVYGRKGKPCLRCDTPIENLIIAGRSSFSCPSCQS